MIADRNRISARGFSTVELMIALCVLSVGVMAIYERFQEAGEASKRQIKQAQAELAAAQKLAELRAVPLDDLKRWNPGAEWTRTAEGVYLRPSLKPLEGGGVEIEISAVWGAPPKPGADPPQSRVKRAKGSVLP